MTDSLAHSSLAGLQEQLAAAGFKPSHAGRLLRSCYAGDESAPGAGPPLPQGLPEWLAGHLPPAPTALAARQVAGDGTVKLLLRLHDGRTVESVLMRNERGGRAAGCLSSQAGCAMGCDFCATTRNGFERNLSAAEIVGQFLFLRREAGRAGRLLRTIVFMGMGEPLLNLDNVLDAVERIADNRLGALGWRQVTLSTVGIVPGIDALAATGLNFHLAVSLHASDDATRARLLPAGRRFPIAEILAAADRFQARRGRPVTIQYCLLHGVNDSIPQAHALADLLSARRMHVNLLHYNATGPSLRGVVYFPTAPAEAGAFAAVLRSRGVVAHFRQPRGREIDAACGQLRERATAAVGGATATAPSPRNAAAAS